jgi:hypothetical protein
VCACVWRGDGELGRSEVKGTGTLGGKPAACPFAVHHHSHFGSVITCDLARISCCCIPSNPTTAITSPCCTPNWATGSPAPAPAAHICTSCPRSRAHALAMWCLAHTLRAASRHSSAASSLRQALSTCSAVWRGGAITATGDAGPLRQVCGSSTWRGWGAPPASSSARRGFGSEADGGYLDDEVVYPPARAFVGQMAPDFEAPGERGWSTVAHTRDAASSNGHAHCRLQHTGTASLLSCC